MANFKRCIDGYKKTRQECTDLRDDGYSSCTDWGKSCTSWAKECVVSWIPIIGPAICKVFEWVCKATEWICTAAVWVVHMVCHAFKLVTTFICTAWEAISWVATIPAIFIKLIFAIPIIGGLIKEIVNLITGFVVGIVGFAVEGILCGLLGVCPAKHMRLCVIISRSDGRPVATPAEIQPFIDRATQIYKAEANVDLWVTVNDGSNGPNIGVASCDVNAWFQDLGTPGMGYELSEGRYCVGGALSSIIGLASPVYAFAVANIEGKNGCSLGLLTNYVLFEPRPTGPCPGNTHLAHEIGHACMLLHTDDRTNLMNRSCADPGRDQISGFQKSIIRGSKYVTYF